MTSYFSARPISRLSPLVLLLAACGNPFAGKSAYVDRRSGVNSAVDGTGADAVQAQPGGGASQPAASADSESRAAVGGLASTTPSTPTGGNTGDGSNAGDGGTSGDAGANGGTPTPTPSPAVTASAFCAGGPLHPSFYFATAADAQTCAQAVALPSAANPSAACATDARVGACGVPAGTTMPAFSSLDKCVCTTSAPTSSVVWVGTPTPPAAAPTSPANPPSPATPTPSGFCAGGPLHPSFYFASAADAQTCAQVVALPSAANPSAACATDARVGACGAPSGATPPAFSTLDKCACAAPGTPANASIVWTGTPSTVPPVTPTGSCAGGPLHPSFYFATAADAETCAKAIAQPSASNPSDACAADARMGACGPASGATPPAYSTLDQCVCSTTAAGAASGLLWSGAPTAPTP